VAIVLREHGYEALVEKIGTANPVAVGAPTLAEATIILSSRLALDARGIVARLLMEGAIETIPFSDAHFPVAVNAWLRYGKGRHKASLNFGDCLAYAIANVAGEPLLFTGRDFAKTDIEAA